MIEGVYQSMKIVLMNQPAFWNVRICNKGLNTAHVGMSQKLGAAHSWGKCRLMA